MLFWHGNNHCYNRNIISPGFIRMEALCWWIIVTEYRAFEVQKRTVHLRNVRSRPSPQIFILFFLVLYHVNLFGSDRSTTEPDQNLVKKKNAASNKNFDKKSFFKNLNRFSIKFKEKKIPYCEDKFNVNIILHSLQTNLSFFSSLPLFSTLF